jgi:DNA-binding HxlR family transcriptional regulator
MQYLSILSEIKAFNEFLGGKWRLIILDQLFANPIRFRDLQKNIDGITPRMLTKELRILEKFELVEKIVYREVPPRVEYSLTDKGVRLFPLLESIKLVGSEFLKEIEANPGLIAQPKLLKVKKTEALRVLKPEPKVENTFSDDLGNQFVKIDVNNLEPIKEDIPLRNVSLSTKKRIEDLHIEEIDIFKEDIQENTFLDSVSEDAIEFSFESDFIKIDEVNENEASIISEVVLPQIFSQKQEASSQEEKQESKQDAKQKVTTVQLSLF